MMNAAATRQLVGRHFGTINGLLIRYLRRMTRCPCRAEDLAQLAWLKLLASAQRGVHPTTESALRAYVFTVARHTFIDECTRKHESVRTRSVDPAILETIESSSGTAGDPEVALQHAQTRELIGRALRVLPQAQRDVVLMWSMGTSIKTMALRANAPADTVLSRKKYAFARLRVDLGGLAETLG